MPFDCSQVLRPEIQKAGKAEIGPAANPLKSRRGRPRNSEQKTQCAAVASEFEKTLTFQRHAAGERG